MTQLVPAPVTHGFLLDNGTFTTIDAPKAWAMSMAGMAASSPYGLYRAWPFSVNRQAPVLSARSG